jgi:glycosyltransferase involved in cell wall biosynthesis
LLRAIGAGASTIAFDVNFNREVIGDTGRYFGTAADVRRELEAAEENPRETGKRGLLARRRATRYDWDDVASRYEALCKRLVYGARSRGERPSCRRANLSRV